MPFQLRSEAFEDQQRIPSKYTADGEDISPPLAWSDPPSEARSFALMSRTRTHRQEHSAAGASTTSWRDVTACRKVPAVAPRRKIPGWASTTSESRATADPRRRKDTGTHHDRFKLLALDVESLMPAPKAAAADIRKAAEGHIVGQAELIGTYSR